MRLGIEPFREFWVDCFSTLINSIVCSKTDIPKEFVYDNNYVYTMSRIDFPQNKVLWTIAVQAENSSIVQELFSKVEYTDFVHKDDLVSELHNLLDQKKIIFLGVDLFYWVSDNFNWHRNHFNHFSLINGYDEKKKIFYILETGATGYMEYEISEEELVLAARGFLGEASMVAQINQKIKMDAYTSEEMIINAKKVIASINEILKGKKQILDCSILKNEEYWKVLDHIQTHLYGIESRQKANSLLIKRMLDSNGGKFFDAFSELEGGYSLMKNRVLKANIDKKHIDIEEVKNKFFVLLMQEKQIWKEILETTSGIKNNK